MHPVLQAAVHEATEAFGWEQVAFTERPDGSVQVTISGLDIGGNWEPRVVGITTTLLTTFPSPPPYPFYLPPGLRKTDGSAVPNMTSVTFEGVAMTQLSVRPQGNRPAGSLPALILSVVSWLRNR